MKRYIRKPNTKVITIDIVLDYDDSSIAAAELIKHPENIARKRRINDIKLQILNDVAASALSAVRSKKHLIVNEKKTHQAGNTYSFYIEFNVVDDEGNLIVPVGIKFRISNHKLHGEETSVDTSTVIIRSFVLKGKNYENYVDIIMKIDSICEELDKGNIQVLNDIAE